MPQRTGLVVESMALRLVDSCLRVIGHGWRTTQLRRKQNKLNFVPPLSSTFHFEEKFVEGMFTSCVRTARVGTLLTSSHFVQFLSQWLARFPQFQPTTHSFPFHPHSFCSPYLRNIILSQVLMWSAFHSKKNSCTKGKLLQFFTITLK